MSSYTKIKAIAEYLDEEGIALGDGSDGDMMRAGAAILLEQSERIKELENPWVSVEDRLPDEGGMYLVHTHPRDDLTREIVTPYRVVGFYMDKKGNDEMWLDGTIITHWMFIPSPII